MGFEKLFIKEIPHPSYSYFSHYHNWSQYLTSKKKSLKHKFLSSNYDNIQNKKSFKRASFFSPFAFLAVIISASETSSSKFIALVYIEISTYHELALSQLI